jgi:hypothetical protein
MKPLLTIDIIRENPWSVLTHVLPPAPDKILLGLAYLAAEYCCLSEHLLTQAAREGEYVPTWWNPHANLPDVHEDSEDRWLRSLDKVELIRDLFADLYGQVPNL